MGNALIGGCLPLAFLYGRRMSLIVRMRMNQGKAGPHVEQKPPANNPTPAEPAGSASSASAPNSGDVSFLTADFPCTMSSMWTMQIVAWTVRLLLLLRVQFRG